MHFRETSIEGLYVVEPVMYGDERGFFYEQFQAVEFQSHGLVAQYLQDNCSSSQRYTLRGLHYQRAPYAQTKLVRAVAGRILDVAVDIRPASPTFGKHYAVELSDTNHLALYIPKGFAHGFLALSDLGLSMGRCRFFRLKISSTQRCKRLSRRVFYEWGGRDGRLGAARPAAESVGR